MDGEYAATPDSGYETSKVFDEQMSQLQTQGTSSTPFFCHATGYAPAEPSNPFFAQPFSISETSNHPSSPLQNEEPAMAPRSKPRPPPKPIVNVEEVEGYPPASAPVPLGLTCFEVCQQYPNSLYGENLDPFIQYNWSCSQVYVCLPTSVKRAMTVNHLNSKNPSNAIAKRICKRRARLQKCGELNILLNGPKLRVEGREPGFKANGRFPVRISSYGRQKEQKTRNESLQPPSSKSQRPLPPFTLPHDMTDHTTLVKEAMSVSNTPAVGDISSWVRTVQSGLDEALPGRNAKSQLARLQSVPELNFRDMNDPHFNGGNKPAQAQRPDLAESTPYCGAYPQRHSSWEWPDPNCANSNWTPRQGPDYEYPELNDVNRYSQSFGREITQPHVDEIDSYLPDSGDWMEELEIFWPDLPVFEPPIGTPTDQFIPRDARRPPYKWCQPYNSEQNIQANPNGAGHDIGLLYEEPIRQTTLDDTEGGAASIQVRGECSLGNTETKAHREPFELYRFE